MLSTNRSYFSLTIVLMNTDTVIKQKLLELDLSDNVSSVLSEVSDDYKVKKIWTKSSSSTNDRGGAVGGHDCHEIEANTPLHVVAGFGGKYIVVHVSKIEQEQETRTPTEKSFFSVLMQQKKCYPPKIDFTKERSDFVLYNDLLDLFHEKEFHFSPESVHTAGKEVLKTLSGVLWWLTPHHKKLAERLVTIPDMFAKFSNYYDHRLAHKASPKIESSRLKAETEKLSELLMMPWMSKHKELYDAVGELASGLQKYYDFLEKQQIRNAKAQHSDAPLRSPDVNFSMENLDTTTVIESQYDALNDTVLKSIPYSPIYIDDYEPSDKRDRRKFVQNLKLTKRVKMYSYYHGNYLGTVRFVWRLPDDPAEHSDEKTIAAVEIVHKSLPLYATRAMKKEFFEAYQKSTKIQPALLRSMYKFLTNDSSAPETKDQSEVDDRLCNFLMLDDCDVAWDLRKLNGNFNGTKFDVFWEELEKYFNEITLPVQERRHGEHLYLPFAVSVESLIEIICGRLPKDVPVPSSEWVRLQFWPTDPTTKRAFHHTGRFNIKFKLQTRQIRGDHPDGHYCGAQLLYLKHFAIKYRMFADFFWLDDKAIVPIGEPDKPVSTNVRPHNASLVPQSSSVGLSALDHDYNVCGAVPSVAFKSEIPKDASCSFFSGTVHVTVKDKIFEPSNAIRHGCELTQIIRQYYSLDDVNAANPILICYTDGGPDHRTTYGSVQLAAICTFIQLDLDMLVTARTAPMASWANLAERANSILNLGLQNVALERERMTPELELKQRRISSLDDARKLSARYPEFRDGLIHSVEPVLKLLESRFSKLKLKGETFQINKSATVEEVEGFFQTLKDVIDSDLDQHKLTAGVLSAIPRLCDFMERHCQKRNYSFQVKKCPSSVNDCWYCGLFPPRMPADDFSSLYFVPDPTLPSPGSEKYLSFVEVYGEETTDSERPSLCGVTDCSKNDSVNKKLLTANKVRDVVICVECHKPRCVYSNTKLQSLELKALKLVKEKATYTCGATLFPETELKSTVIVRESLTCSSKMETTYYASKTCTLEGVCFHCGVAKSKDFAIDSEIQKFQTEYTTVRPICVKCKDDGKEVVVRGKRNVKKLRTK